MTQGHARTRPRRNAEAVRREDRPSRSRSTIRRRRSRRRKSPPSTDAAPPPPPPEPKQEAKKKAEPKRDLIAEALKKDDAKKAEQKKAERQNPDAAEAAAEPSQQQPKFDPREIAGAARQARPAAQGSHRRRRQRHAVARHAERHGARSSRRTNSTRCGRGLRNCGIRRPARRIREEIVVAIRMRLKPDGTIAAAADGHDLRAEPAVHGVARQRHPRGLPRPAVRHAAARDL